MRSMHYTDMHRHTDRQTDQVYHMRMYWNTVTMVFKEFQLSNSSECELLRKHTPPPPPQWHNPINHHFKMSSLSKCVMAIIA